MGCFRRLAKGARSCWGSVTLEPAILMYAINLSVYGISASELYITKVCKVNLGLEEDVCDDIQKHKDEQAEVQRNTTTIRVLSEVLQAVPVVVFAMFAGPWSDTNGRKLLVILSSFGHVLSGLVMILNMHFFHQLRAEFLLLECLQDLTGGIVVFVLSTNAYIADITEPEHRTKRLALLNGLWPVGMATGHAIAGLVKVRLGLVYNFVISACMALGATVYVVLFVKDSDALREKRLERHREEVAAVGMAPIATVEDATVEVVTESDWAKWRRNVGSIFDASNVKSGFQVIFKKRRHNMRLYIMVMILFFSLEMCIRTDDFSSSSYLYLRRKLDFTMVDYARFRSITTLFVLVAMLVVIPVLSDRFGWHDLTIALLDVSGSLANTLILAFATAEWMIYFGRALAFLDKSTLTLLRSMLSKHVQPDEVGKVLAAVGVIQAVMPLFMIPLYGFVYRATVETLPQAYLFLLAGCVGLQLAFLLGIYRGLRRAEEKMDAVFLTELDHAADGGPRQ